MKQLNIMRVQCDECDKHYYVQDGMAAPQFTLTVEHDCCMEKDKGNNCQIATIHNEKHFCGYKCVADFCLGQIHMAESYEKSILNATAQPAMSDDEFNEKYTSLKDDIEGVVMTNLRHAAKGEPLEGEVSDADSLQNLFAENEIKAEEILRTSDLVPTADNVEKQQAIIDGENVKNDRQKVDPLEQNFTYLPKEDT